MFEATDEQSEWADTLVKRQPADVQAARDSELDYDLVAALVFAQRAESDEILTGSR